MSLKLISQEICNLIDTIPQPDAITIVSAFCKAEAQLTQQNLNHLIKTLYQAAPNNASAVKATRTLRNRLFPLPQKGYTLQERAYLK